MNTTTDTHNNNNFNNTNEATLSVDDNTQHNDPRQVYGWDTFMTHSCNPNAYFPPVHKSNTECQYKAIALRDIYAGEEVTCDYATFDYSVAASSSSSSSTGLVIEPCVCGSTNCRGKMVGFQDLSLHEEIINNSHDDDDTDGVIVVDKRLFLVNELDTSITPKYIPWKSDGNCDRSVSDRNNVLAVVLNKKGSTTTNDVDNNNKKSSATIIVDARSSGRFYGTEPEPRPGLRGGHIP